MILEIRNKIEAINKSLAWIKKNKPEHYEQRFMQLVDERRKLRKIEEAEKDNPAMAAYGKSQVGKSYLMSNMLQRQETLPDGGKIVKAFEVEDEERKYNFINEMNPITHDTEATGVVTRFSSFVRNPSRHERKYPILMKTLSVMDLTLLLCDGYFNDLKDSDTPDRNSINAIADQLYDKYKSAQPASISPITADDMLEMKEYFKHHIMKAQEFRASNFFDKLALVIDRIPVADYPDIFSILWRKTDDNNDYLTPLYRRLLATMSKLQFCSDVYFGVDAVLHHEENENTIMSVQCLDGLGTGDTSHVCDAHLKQANGTFTTIPAMLKCELSAVCAEIVVLIGPDFLESTASYSFEDITDNAVRSRLTQGPIKLDLLKHTDLLDFPGARSRMGGEFSSLSEGKVLTRMLLRGKVAYLFNKYSESRVVNILMFCQDNTQCDVNTIPSTLNDWVSQYVGATPEERARTLQLTGGISPLFFVATKFNITMQEDQNPSANGRTSIDGRWGERFTKVLYKECFDVDSTKWANNWTRPGEYFKNSYLLRDFKYSGMKGSKIYDGFRERGKEDKLLVDRAYLDLLRATFCESKHTEMFFQNREMVWDATATMNNDGALYIIEQLAKVAAVMDKTRDIQFEDYCRVAMDKVRNIMSEFHVSEDVDILLKKNIRKANQIIREMDFTCNEDSYFFGHLLQSLELTETKSLQAIHNLIQSGELSEKIHDTSNYEIIMKRCGQALKACKNNDERWQVLMDCYVMDSQEEAQAYLEKRNVDYKKLFDGTFKKKLNSVIIAEKVYTLWKNQIKSLEFMNQLANSHQFDMDVMVDLVDEIVDTSIQLSLEDRLAATIAEYVNVVNVFSINESLIADILASTINSFVIDLGYHLLDADEINKARQIAEKRHLPAFNYIEKTRPSTFEEEELTAMFDELTSNPKALTTAFENNYYSWLEYMFVSFITHLNIPDYDHEANEALTKIINELS